MRENITESLVQAISRCDAANTEALENLCRAAACLTCWGGAVLRGLSQPHALSQPFTVIRDWSRVSHTPLTVVQEDEGPKTPQKGGKKPPTPAVEEPKTPGPPVDALIACIRWVCCAVHGSHHAAAAACDLSASHFINLLKHPSPVVIRNSLMLLNAMTRLSLCLQALVRVCYLQSSPWFSMCLQWVLQPGLPCLKVALQATERALHTFLLVCFLSRTNILCNCVKLVTPWCMHTYLLSDPLSTPVCAFSQALPQNLFC